jgi:hypothetical protein
MPFFLSTYGLIGQGLPLSRQLVLPGAMYCRLTPRAVFHETRGPAARARLQTGLECSGQTLLGHLSGCGDLAALQLE